MTTEANKAIVRSYLERAVNQNDLAWLEQIIGAEFGTEQTRSVGFAQTLKVFGPAAARAALEHYRQALPDIQFKVQDMLAEDDRVVVQVTFRGTHRGEFLGVPATGRVLNGSGVEMAVLKEGKIVAAGWQYHDELSLLRQMGALPAHNPSRGGHAPHGGKHDSL
jgi:steroid delta-isomerase-like uncharacterized protein